MKRNFTQEWCNKWLVELIYSKASQAISPTTAQVQIQAISREDLKDSPLKQVIDDNNLAVHLERIYNMDETKCFNGIKSLHSRIRYRIIGTKGQVTVDPSPPYIQQQRMVCKSPVNNANSQIMPL